LELIVCIGIYIKIEGRMVRQMKNLILDCVFLLQFYLVIL